MKDLSFIETDVDESEIRMIFVGIFGCIRA